MSKAMYAKVAGKWVKVYPPAPPPPTYNDATGGTVTTYTTADGKLMRVHTFADDGTLTVAKTGHPWQVAMIGGGVGYNDIGYLNPPNANWPQGIGCNGESINITDGVLSLGDVPVVVGNGGPPGTSTPGAPTVSSVGTIATAASSGIVRDKTVPPLVTSIRGKEETFPSADTGDVGAGGSASGTTSFPGKPGIVIVAYEVEPPTPGLFNDAEGGTVTEYTKTDGTKWRVHRFDATGTFVVKEAVKDFRVLLAGGGGPGGTSGPYYTTGGPGGNGQTVEQTIPLTVGDIPVSIGGTSTFATMTAAGGGGGGSGWSNGVTGGNGGPGQGYPALDSDITGTVVSYSGGGGGAGGPAHCDGCQPNGGGAGGPGYALIAYEVKP